MTYAEKLKDPRWKKLSASIKAQEHLTCLRCGRKSYALHVHHRLYERGREPWEYERNNFECLCDECHAEIEDLLKRLRFGCCTLTFRSLRRVLKYVVQQTLSGKLEHVKLTVFEKERMEQFKRELC